VLLPKGEAASREKMRTMLRSGALNERDVEVDVSSAPSAPMISMLGSTEMGLDMASGLQDAIQSAFGGGGKRKKKKMKVPAALEALTLEEAAKLVDQEQIKSDGVQRAEQDGIIFIDEIDKIAASGGGRGPDVSREGVQRDILPIIEGSTVTTKHGQLKTVHILFICAGAFHMSKPSDLIPELQGRLPIRVELKPLTREDFVRILKETESSLVLQYQALLRTEGVELSFADDGLDAIANVAAEVNSSQENIGARRLATILERLLEEESFDAADKRGMNVVVDRVLVEKRLAPILKREDLSKFIL
jgi:ATP-dependent HslUV protease ATP-binding subunit HslU